MFTAYVPESRYVKYQTIKKVILLCKSVRHFHYFILISSMAKAKVSQKNPTITRQQVLSAGVNFCIVHLIFGA